MTKIGRYRKKDGTNDTPTYNNDRRQFRRGSFYASPLNSRISIEFDFNEARITSLFVGGERRAAKATIIIIKHARLSVILSPPIVNPKSENEKASLERVRKGSVAVPPFRNNARLLRESAGLP